MAITELFADISEAASAKKIAADSAEMAMDSTKTATETANTQTKIANDTMPVLLLQVLHFLSLQT